jgi:hypothetical protein
MIPKHPARQVEFPVSEREKELEVENERLKVERAAAIDRLTPLGCENEELRAQLHAIRNESLSWALVCSCDCPACNGLYEAIRGAEPQSAEQ